VGFTRTSGCSDSDTTGQQRASPFRLGRAFRTEEGACKTRISLDGRAASEAACQDPEITTVDSSSAAASPAFESIKSAERAIVAVLKSHRSRVEGARSALAPAERAYESRVAKARTAVDRAAQPNKIAAIGIVRRVTLTETTITTPKGQFELTPEVEASAEQHGNKQVVQGCVFKSDHDRREVYLHINGPTWGGCRAVLSEAQHL
jgi:hypothetical protein